MLCEGKPYFRWDRGGKGGGICIIIAIGMERERKSMSNIMKHINMNKYYNLFIVIGIRIGEQAE